jgi:hypothetical protein
MRTNMAISAKQWHTVKAAKELAGKSKTVTRDMLVRAHRIGYPNLANADARTVSAYVAMNLKSPAFMGALNPIAVNEGHDQTDGT